MTTGLRPVAILTGASGGIGSAVLRALVERGFDVVAVARDRRTVIGASEVFEADLASVADVSRVGRELAERLPRVDVLINNAGLHAFSQRITGDGLPVMVAVNHVAPFLLVQALLPRLTDIGGRIVHVASDAHRRVATLTLPDDLENIADFTARESSLLYARSKLLGVLFTKALARRIEGTGVTTNSCCPGLNVTGLGRESRVFSMLARFLKRVGVFSPERGARIITRLASDPALGRTSGDHFSHGGQIQADTALVADVDLQERLWRETAALPAIAALEPFS